MPTSKKKKSAKAARPGSFGTTGCEACANGDKPVPLVDWKFMATPEEADMEAVEKRQHYRDFAKRALTAVAIAAVGAVITFFAKYLEALDISRHPVIAQAAITGLVAVLRALGILLPKI